MTFQKGDRVEYHVDQTHEEWVWFRDRIKHNGTTGTVSHTAFSGSISVIWDNGWSNIPMVRNVRLIDEPVQEEDWS